MKEKGSIAIAIICMLLTFMLTWQFRSVTASGGLTNDTARARADQLQGQLISEQEKSEALLRQLLEYQEELKEFSAKAEKSGGYAEVLADQLEQTMILSGQAAVQGQGVIVKLSDSRRPNTTGVDENNYVIHDEDLLKVVNELRDAGAEAIAINGERMLATSEVRCAGSIVSVNNKRFSAPYTVSAIGNSDQLYNALSMRQGVVDSLAVWGIQCDVSRSPSITIKGYEGALEYKYAKPVKELNTDTQAQDGGTKK